VSVRFDVVALGEAMIEFNEARSHDPHAWLQGFGGDTSNMAVAAARLGARSAYVTRVGDDAFGRRLLALWMDERVSTEGVAIDESAPTGVYFVSHGAEGHEFSYLRSGSAAPNRRAAASRESPRVHGRAATA
jgi:2-dehydro-3-deoxygluconokinase